MTVAISSSTVVGALACQRNSFLKTLKTKVVSCQKYQPILTSKDKQNLGKKKDTDAPQNQQELYAVELEDTILFPEGGGQPYDKGSLTPTGSDKVPVQMVLRKELTAIHITQQPVEIGSEVTLDVDWNRRFDIMQQHTGQHLISAVFDTYGLETLSWSMGNPINYIELPRKVDNTVLSEVSSKINKLIVDNLPIRVTTPDKLGHEIDVSHIPDDYDLSKGVVRVVRIGDIDSNPCCGTHLTSTGQIQAVALLHQTNIRGGNSRLSFLCGQRVATQLANYHSLLKEVSGSSLSCQIEEVPTKVAELNQNYRKSQSRESSLLKELARIEALEIFNLFKNGEAKIAKVYRQENSSEYLTTFQKEFTTLMNASKDHAVNLKDAFTIVLLNGDYKSGTGGMVKIMGPLADQVQTELKNKLSNLKGGGKGPSYQGKVTKYEKGEIESVLKYLDTLKLED